MKVRRHALRFCLLVICDVMRLCQRRQLLRYRRTK